MKKNTREPIIVRRGYVGVLANECGVSRSTVSKALHWDTDNDIQNLIRERAEKYRKRF